MAVATSTLVAGAAIAASVGGALEQRQAGKRAEREQRKANRAEGASAQVENARRRRMAVAQARVQQAQNVASQSAGVSGSSALTGAQGAISSGMGSGIAAATRQVNTAQFSMDRRQAASSAMRRGNERAGVFNAIGQGAQFGLQQWGPGGALQR